jgi:hypothetical protein
MRIIGGADRLTIPLEGRAKEAHSRLVNIGSRALPALREKNERLIAEHQAYREWLRTGLSSNPLENYSLKSDAEKQYRHVIEMQQARVLNVIKEIEAAAR